MITPAPRNPTPVTDALDHAALLGAGRRVDRQNSQGRAEAHEAERAHPGLLAVQIAVEPEQDADQGRRAEPNRDVEDVHNGTILAPQMAIYRLPGSSFPTGRQRRRVARPQSSEPPTGRRVEASPWTDLNCSESSLGAFPRRLFDHLVG